LFQEQVRYLADDDQIKVVILRMKNARHLDATSVMSLLQLHEYLQRTKRHLLISGINEEVERVLVRSGAMQKIGRENVFAAESNLTMSTKRALLRASNLLQQSSGGLGVKSDVRIFMIGSGKKWRVRPQPRPRMTFARVTTRSKCNRVMLL
jgi:SulP family sulfate permease